MAKVDEKEKQSNMVKVIGNNNRIEQNNYIIILWLIIKYHFKIYQHSFIL